MYTGNFTNWRDVKNEFSMDESEPEKVYFATYKTECYEGSAIVIYRNKNKYYIVEGGHCSCYGLEDQWSPTEYTKEQLKKVLEQHSYYISLDDRQNIIKELEND